MSDPDLIERLAQHRALSSAPRAELEWLAAHGYLRRAERGESITQTPEFFDKMAIVLSGHIAISIDRGLGPRKVMEWHAGDVSGVLPYSRMSGPPPGGDALIDEPGELFMIPRSEFPELIRACPTVTTTLVHMMLDRVRRFSTSDFQDEKMASLGRLSAGLAHELNNPASAAERSAQLLPDALDALGDAARMLGAARLSAEQYASVERWQKASASTAPPMRSTLEHADREDALAGWLDEHGIDTAIASPLVDTPLTVGDLDRLAATLDAAALKPALKWLAADCSARALASEIERATVRMHTLVAAIKKFSYMDRVQASESISLVDSFSDALALLQHKTRPKAVNLVIDLPPDLPRVCAIGSDLNQVWMNLIDNAIDAVSQGGRVQVTAERRLNFVHVRIVDDGCGIAPDIIDRIFDPFFTTKPVGQGTGLGLDIAQRLVRRNNGDIGVESRPGRTEFHVTLPVAPGTN
jgi:signal transduction histidine kinase